MKKLNFSKFKKIIKEFSDFLQENIMDDSYCYRAHNVALKNGINNYIDYINISLIYNFFSADKDLKLLDLGCGVGDKSFLLKNIFPTFEIFGLETTAHDDPEHIKNSPHLFYEDVYQKINSSFAINLGLYNGLDIPYADNHFDIILLYAVIEHIAPAKRAEFLRSIEKKLKTDGFFIITRCPRRFGLIEFISRRLKLGAHEWVLAKNELLSLFPEDSYKIEALKIMNNIPNNYNFTKRLYHPLIFIDKALSFLRWPLATDYFLIAKKISG